MAQADLELQLKVWKDLAINKQVLMRAAADTLKLNPDCSADELRSALDATIKRAANAEASVKELQERSRTTIDEMEKKLAASEKARLAAETATADVRAALDKAEQQAVNERAASAKELKSVKDRLAEQERALKAINSALADTPENVLKKLRALKKDKMDEADARKKAEALVNTVRKEKRDLEQQVTTLKSAAADAAKLAAQYRELHQQCEAMHAQLKPLVADADVPAAPPALDSALLEAVEKAAAGDEKK